MTVDEAVEETETMSVEACDRELDHLRLELADFPLRPRRLAILSSIDRWLDARLAATQGAAE